jgi:hypothetical protein
MGVTISSCELPAIFDYDGDGFKDLCYTKNGWADGQWGFRFNKGLGNGNFSASTITSYATQRPYDDFVKLHANPMVNSIPDVLFNCSNDGTNGGNFYIGEWNQSLGNFNFYTLPTGTNSETMLLQSIDYNNDGMADIIMRYRTGTNPYYYTTVAYLNNGYGGFGSTDTIMKNTPYYPHQMFKDNWELKLSAYGNSDTLYVFSIFPNLPATIPAPAGAISGNSTVCPGQTAVIYSISPIAHATSYIWTLPPGATGTSTTNSIAVNYSNSAVSGTITVQGSNTCSRGATATVQVSVAPCTVVVENQTLGSGQTQCISAVQTVTIGGNGGTFLINPGGSSTMIAGLNVKYLPNTKVKSGGYMLGYITTNGQYCTQISNPVVNSPVSFLPAALDVPEISADQVFRVYPNPTGGEFTVECLGNTPDFLTHITVFSMSGKQVFDNALVHVKTHVCSISTLPPGLYFIHLRSENQTKVLKILKI